MKTFESFQAWYKEQNLSQKRLITQLRKLVSDVSPELTESSKWGNGVWLKAELPLIFAHCKPDHIQFGFFAGATLPDPKKLLKGSGKFVRHIKIESKKDIHHDEFAKLIKKAVSAPPYR